MVKLSAAALHVHRLVPGRILQLLPLLAAASASAATFTWDGNAPSGNGSSRWSSGNNWVGNNAPAANQVSGLTNSDIVFAGNLKLAPFLTSDYYVRSVSFAAGAGAFQINPFAIFDQTLYLGAGGITNNSANLQSFNLGLSLRANQTWNAAAGNLAINDLLDLNNNTLTIAGNFTTSINDQIQDTGSMVKEGMGNLILGGSGANTFSGGLRINNGTVSATKANALGVGPLTLAGGTLNLGNNNATVSAFSLQGGTFNSTAGAITSSSGYQVQAGTLAGRLAGSGSLTKTTGGIVELAGANTYSGGTRILGGKLVVNNLTGSGTGTGSVLIGGGGLLTGSGSISGMVTNGPGGSISAGDEIGILNLGNTIWFGGATNRWDIADATGGAGVGWDLLNINGTLTLSATAANRAIIDVVSFTLGNTPGTAVNFDPSQNYLWTIVQTTGGISFLPGESAATVFDLFTGNFLNNWTGGDFDLALSADGRSLNVSYTGALAVPEPNRVAMLGLGLCGFVYVRRFKQNWVSARR